MSLTRQQILDLIASDAKLDEVKALVGQVSATPTANTVLARLKELETKIDAIKDTDGVKKITDTVNAQLTGSTVAIPVDMQFHDIADVSPIPVKDMHSIPEYIWLAGDAAITLGADDRALGVEINTTTHEMTTKYWNGTAWGDLE